MSTERPKGFFPLPGSPRRMRADLSIEVPSRFKDFENGSVIKGKGQRGRPIGLLARKGAIG